MKKWQKERNYGQIKDKDGNVIKNIIKINGQSVEVSEEVFLAYSQSDRKVRYKKEKDTKKDKPLSIEALREYGVSIEGLLFNKNYKIHMYSPYTNTDEELIEIILNEIAKLPSDERELIKSICINGMTTRKYAELKGCSHSTVVYHKKRILEKIRKNIVL